MNLRLYVGNLAFSTEKLDRGSLHRSRTGPVRQPDARLRQCQSAASRSSKWQPKRAPAAIERFNEAEFEGRRLTVNEARPQEQRTGGGGGGFGGARRSNGGGNSGGFGGNRRREARW